MAYYYLVVNSFAKPSNRKFGTVSLVPSFATKKRYEKLGAVVATTQNIFETVKSLKDGCYEKTVVFANRYDGIDLPDKACRILIIDSKPYFDYLLDRYEEDCRLESDIMNTRTAQKVEQGLGRSVRGEKDYSVIILIGGDLIKFAKSPQTSKYFSSQTRRQIEIGIQVAEFAKEDSKNEKASYVLLNTINQALQRDEGWKEYYTEEMEDIESDLKKSEIYKILQVEYDAERQFMIGEYEKACKLIQKLSDHTNDKLERGWYLQELARYKYRTSKVDSNRIQKSAFQNNLQLLKPRQGITYRKLEFINQNRVSRIKDWVSKYRNYEEMIMSVDGILQNLSFGKPSEKFELALKELGESIGFQSQRPDKEIKKGPDNLWCGVEKKYFLIECKNEVEETRAEISKYEAGQMNSHSAWFESMYGDAKCKRILIIPTKKLSYHGDFTHDVEIMRQNSLIKLKKNVRNFFKEFSNYIIHEITDQKIQQLIDSHNLNTSSLETDYTENYYHSKK